VGGGRVGREVLEEKWNIKRGRKKKMSVKLT
jgi:hypothetical protein